jgi:hypothetical protein
MTPETGDQRLTRRKPAQGNTNPEKIDRHPRLDWDLNPRPTFERSKAIHDLPGLLLDVATFLYTGNMGRKRLRNVRNTADTHTMPTISESIARMCNSARCA